jgi:cytochrome c oxidase subunit 4
MTDTAVDAAVDAHDDHHPSDLFYLKIAAILALFTAFEVGTYFVEDSVPRWFLFLSLTVLMIIKFVMVAAYFMHLKYDTPWFRYLFIAGLVLAIGVYTIFFFTFDLFGLG